MTYSEIQRLEKRAQHANQQSLLDPEALEGYYSKQEQKDTGKDNPFVYFYEDIIEAKLLINFKEILGTPYYPNAESDAWCCLHICDEFKKLSTWSVSGWLQNALKFIDHMVLHYIQKELNELPKKYSQKGEESSRYQQLSEKPTEIAKAGNKLLELYKLRNGLEHRTRTLPDGQQMILKPKRAEIRKTVSKLYPEVLHVFISVYKEKNKASI